MVRIITDSASDITLSEAAELGVEIVHLQIMFEDGPCPQIEKADFDIFYERLLKAEKLPVTSQPSPEQFLQHFNECKVAGDEAVVICLSSGISGTYQSANIAKEMAEYDKIYVVDTKQAILSERMLVERAVTLRDQGKSAGDIAETLHAKRDQVYVCGALDTLTYLKKGGRIPPALATLGNALNIKPAVYIEDGVLKVLGMSRGKGAARKQLLQQIEKHGCSPDWPVYFGYTLIKEECEAFMAEACEIYGLKNAKLCPVGGVIGTHVGPGCIALAFGID